VAKRIIRETEGGFDEIVDFGRANEKSIGVRGLGGRARRQDRGSPGLIWAAISACRF